MSLEDLPGDFEERIVTTSVMDYMHFYDLKREDYELGKFHVSHMSGEVDRNTSELYGEAVERMKRNKIIALCDIRISEVSQGGSDDFDAVFKSMLYGTAIIGKEKKQEDGIVRIGPGRKDES
jgi:hypothetical protein